MKLKGAAVPIVVSVMLLSGCGGGNTTTTGFSLVSASLVLGQADFASYLTNQNGAAGANTLNQPLGDAAFDATNNAMFVPDAGNNRVLRFSPIPTANNISVNSSFGVLGQPGFTTTTPSPNGLSSPNNASLLVASSTESYLVVSDTSNNRVLIYSPIPTSASPTPIAIIGQLTAATHASGCSATTLNNPTDAIMVGSLAGGDLQLLVVDQNNDRVLVYNFGSTAPPTYGAAASLVLGQGNGATLTTCTAPTPVGTNPESATTLNGPTGIWSNGYKLLVSDTQDDRVLYWPTIPTDQNNVGAEYPLGQTTLVASSTGISSLYLSGGPTGVTSDGSRVFVADTANNRIMIFDQFPSSSAGENASFVLGQENFTFHSPNDDNGDSVNPQVNLDVQGNVPTARTLNSPQGVAYNSADGSLWVTDTGNNRVLQFQKAALSTSEVVDSTTN